MAENETGVPPKKETGKVQPKKETVRINLPPRPSAAPTIKMPTVPPAGTVSGATGTAAQAPGPAAAQATPAPKTAPAAQPAPVAVKAGPAAQAVAPQVEKIDSILAIGSAIAALIVAASVLYLLLQTS
jgi:hypothetical protein